MTETIDQLYARWLDARTAELEKAAQALIHSEDPEAAFREALNQPAEQPSDVLEAFSANVTPEPDGLDGPYIEALGRRISRAEANEVLARWNGPVSLFGVRGSLGEQVADALNQANEEWEASEARDKAARQATINESLRNDHLNRTGK